MHVDDVRLVPIVVEYFFVPRIASCRAEEVMPKKDVDGGGTTT